MTEAGEQPEPVGAGTLLGSGVAFRLTRALAASLVLWLAVAWALGWIGA